MSGILSRLGRLARAELNSLSDRLRERDAWEDGDGPDDAGPAPRGRGQAGDAPDRRGGARAQGPASGHAAPTPPPRHAAEAPTGSRYPEDIRKAYAVLELPLGADREAIHAAYRTMMRRYHPDKHAHDPKLARMATEVSMRLKASQDKLLAFLDA